MGPERAPATDSEPSSDTPQSDRSPESAPLAALAQRPGAPALARALSARVRLSNRAVAQALQRQEDGYGYGLSDDPLNAGGFGPTDATIRVRPGPVRTTLIKPRTGEAARAEVEALLTAFAAASGYAEKNRIGTEAVWTVIRAYGMSTKGLAGVRFDPNLKQDHDAETHAEDNEGRESRVIFGPRAFAGGFEWLVHITAHELEHVRQGLLGGYRSGEQDPVSEFLAYSGMVLQVASTPGAPGTGFLGQLRSGASDSSLALPALPPDRLAVQAGLALSHWAKMTGEQRQRYWPEFQGARDKLLERLTNEAPPALRPPAGSPSSPEFARWGQGQPPAADPFSLEYLEWIEASKSPWSNVKDRWQEFDAWAPPTGPAPAGPVGGVVG